MVTETETFSSGTAGAVKKTARLWEAAEALREKIVIISIPICLCGIVGNVTVLWLLFFRIRKTKFSVYFANLAVANLIIIIFDVAIAVVYFTSWHLSLILTRMLTILYISGYDTSFYLFTAAAGERCLSLFFPAWYQKHRPKAFSVVMCCCLWGLSCLVSLVDYFACFPRFSITVDELYVSCMTSHIIAIVIEVIIFFPSMICFTLAVWIRMQRETLATRLDVTIVAVGVLFFIFNIPIRMANIFSFLFPTINFYILSGITLLLDCLSSSVNPLIYLFVGSWKVSKQLVPGRTFLERAMKEEEPIAMETQANVEQA